MIELEKDNLADLLAENKTVIVQYGASWCGNCRLVKPKFKKLAEATPSITFVYADAEKFPNTRSFAEVNNLPTFALFQEGELRQQTTGSKIELVQELIDAASGN